MNIKLLDTVAILNPVSVERLTMVEPEYLSIASLPNGLVGTVVEVYARTEERHYLVEFADTQGREYAMGTLREDELLVLHYEISGLISA